MLYEHRRLSSGIFAHVLQTPSLILAMRLCDYAALPAFHQLITLEPLTQQVWSLWTVKDTSSCCLISLPPVWQLPIAYCTHLQRRVSMIAKHVLRPGRQHC